MATKKTDRTNSRARLKNKLQINTYLEHDQFHALDALATKTRITKSVLFREAIDDLLKKHGVKKPKAGT